MFERVPPVYIKISLRFGSSNIIHLWAFADTGAGVSILDAAFAVERMLRLREQVGNLIAFNGKKSPRRITEDWVTVRCGNNVPIRFKVDVGAEGTSSGEVFIMGRELLAAFGITLGPLPSRFPEEYGGDEVEHERGRRPRRVLDTVVLSAEQEARRTELRRKFEAVLADHAAKVPTDGYINHPDAVVTIKHVAGTLPSYTKQYGSKNPTIHAMVTAAVDALLKEGRISKHDSSTHGLIPRYNIALVAVITYGPNRTIKKLRVCWDCRAINRGMLNDEAPLGNIRALYEKAGAKGNVIWSELDLRAAFLQFRLHPDTHHMLAFTWNGQVYFSNSAVFGLRFMAQFCSRIITMIFSQQRWISVYCDNMLASGRDMDSHYEELVLTVDLCNKYNIRLNTEHCMGALMMTCAKTLGNLLDCNGTRPDPVMVANILDWQIPVNAEQLGTWLGMLSFLRVFIRHYAEMSRPLDKLRNVKPKEFLSMWGPEQILACEMLRRALATCPMLQHPKWERQFAIAVDACNTGIGGVLFQPLNPEDGPTWDTIIKFWSRALRGGEKHYSTYACELAGIMTGLDECEDYVFDREFIMRTDHNALVYLESSKNINKTLMSKFCRLAAFNFTLRHIPGRSNAPSDQLSRMYQLGKRYSETRSWGVDPIDPPSGGEAAVIDMSGDDILVALAHDEQEEVCDAQVLKENPKYKNFGIDQRRPENKAAALVLIASFHKVHHGGTTKVLTAMHEQGYSWLGMRAMIEEVVHNCPACRNWTPARAIFHRLKTTSEIVELPWDMVQVDHCVSFEPSSYEHDGSGCDGRVFTCILVVYDVFTKLVICRAQTSKCSEEIVQTLETLFATVGYPKRIQADNDVCFHSEMVTEFLREHDIHRHVVPPYAHRMQGGVERAIAKVSTMLHKFMQMSGHTWVNQLPRAQAAVNDIIQEESGMSPFALCFNRDLGLFEAYRGVGPLADASTSKEAWRQRQDFLHHTVYPVIEARRAVRHEDQAVVFEKRHFTSDKRVPVGAIVMLKDIRVRGKGDHPFVGPYTVAACTTNNQYVLRDSVGGDLTRVVTRDMFKVLPHATSEADTSAYVDRVVGHRVDKNSKSKALEFLVIWVGSVEPTWVAAADFDDQAAIKLYFGTLSRLPKTGRQVSEERKDAVAAEEQAYDVESIVDRRTRNGVTQYKVKWSGCNELQWIPEANFQGREMIVEFESRHTGIRPPASGPLVVGSDAASEVDLVVPREVIPRDVVRPLVPSMGDEVPVLVGPRSGRSRTQPDRFGSSSATD